MPRPTAVSVTDEEWTASVTALLEEGRADLALLTLTRAADAATAGAHFAHLLDLFVRLPASLRWGEVGARLHLRLLSSLRRHEQTLEVVEDARARGLGAPFLNVFGGWALSQGGRWEEAREALAPALQPGAALYPLEDALAWRVQARVLAALGGEGWRDAYARARLHAWGRPLALVWLEEGATLGKQGAVLEALAAYTQALPLVEGDPYYRALALHNMGLVCLRAGRFGEAEAYFQRVRGVGRGAAAFGARALCGEGAVRRALGEWERAEAAYRSAAALPDADDDDRQQAWRGLGHTLRLAGRPLSALEWLTRATTAVPGERQTGRSWVFVDLAAAHAALSDPGAAGRALDRTGPLGGEDADRGRIVRAELARQVGDTAGALALLFPLSRHTLWAREEAHAFPALFALLGETGQPEPLPRPARPQVSVRAAGPLEVRVNGRPVPLAPTSLAGVLLVALLEAGGRAGSGELALAVSGHEGRSERRGRQAVSRLARDLRRALGWEGSVRAAPGAYVLDPGADWHYDVREARAAGLPVESFLSGVTLPWVLDRETELRQDDSNFLSDQVR